QEVNDVVGNREGPADGAGAAAGGVVRERGRECAEITAAARREAHRVRVSEIDIGAGDGAAGIEIAAGVDVGVLSHRAGLGGGGDHPRLVGAVDGQRHQLGCSGPVNLGDDSPLVPYTTLFRPQEVNDVVGNREGPADGAGAAAGGVVRERGRECAEIT